MGMLEMKSMILKMKNFLHRLNSNWDEKEKMISASRQGKKKKKVAKEKHQDKRVGMTKTNKQTKILWICGMISSAIK